MKVYEKIRFMRQSKGWSQEEMADKLNLSVNGYANIERGETDVQISRLEKIADTLGIELLELFNFGERNVFYWTGDNNGDHFCKNLQSTDFSDEKNELEHELEKARLLLQQQDKEIAYLKEIISLIKKENVVSV
jgi:transcriptional regulator with XRE-family HTH domain